MIRWIVTALVGTALLGAGLFIPKRTQLRYRITVEIETPSGLRSGSSVVEATIERRPALLGDTGIHHLVEGEAVAVDLPNGNTLFALLGGGSYHVELPGRALLAAQGTTNSLGLPNGELASAELWDTLRRERIRLDVPERLRTRIVHFADLSRPETVMEIRPDTITTVIGPDYRISSVNIVPTDDAVTRGLPARLPWWDRYHDRQLDGQRINNSVTLVNRLNLTDFLRE